MTASRSRSLRRAFIDIQALQSPTSAGRGIGRYVTDLARALVGAQAPVAALALSPAAPVPPAMHRDLRDSGLVTWNTAASFRKAQAESPLAYVIASPFEGVSPVDTLLPPYVADADVPLVTILYDLVPLLLAEEYLDDPTVRRAYEQRLQVLRGADLLLAISEHARRDAIDLLGIDPDRVVAIGTGAGSFFRPPHPHDRAPEAVRRRFPLVTRPFVLCVTATDPRKNTELLLQAWTLLPETVRRAHQLVLAGHFDEDTLRQWEAHAEAIGLRPDEVLIAGSVTDTELRSLYQVARLVAAPSRYEGFGLPILEAARCGAPAVVADSGASPEILECAASTFPADDADAAAAVIATALDDGATRALLLEAAARAASTHTWESVVARAMAALDALDERRSPERRRGMIEDPTMLRRSRLAIIGALPPTPGRTAEYHEQLADDLAEHCRLDWFAPDASGPGATRTQSWRRFSITELGRIVSPFRYDALVYILGTDAESDATIIEQARRVPGTLWLHDPGAAPPEVLAAATGIMVERERDVAAVALHAGPGATLPRISVLPVVGTAGRSGLVTRTPRAERPLVGADELTIVAIGGARPGRRAEILLEAVGYLARQLTTTLVFVPPIDAATEDGLLQRALELDIGDNVRFASSAQATDATYAVLLGPSDGNDGVILANVLADGVPVVTDQVPPFGSGAMWLVDVDIDAAELSTELLALTRSPDDLAKRRDAARVQTDTWELGDVSRHLLSRVGLDPISTAPGEDPRASAVHVAAWARPEVAAATPTTPDHLALLAPLIDDPIVVVDVGCRWGFADVWSRLGGAARLYGFEPDEAECARLTAAYRDHPEITIVPRALGRERSTANLHLTREPACTSLYPPGAATHRHPAMAPMRLARVESVTLETLDAWAGSAGVPRVDVLKADTQGSELDVLAGAEATLRQVRALELEVEFNPIYERQPLFGDIDRFLRDRGFVLWRLRHLVHYGQDGTHAGTEIDDVQFFDDEGVGFTARGGQLFWGMAYYVNAEVANPALVDDWRVLVRDACLLTALDCPDLAGIALSRANALAPTPEAFTMSNTDTA